MPSDTKIGLYKYQGPFGKFYTRAERQDLQSYGKWIDTAQLMQQHKSAVRQRERSKAEQRRIQVAANVAATANQLAQKGPAGVLSPVEAGNTSYSVGLGRPKHGFKMVSGGKIQPCGCSRAKKGKGISGRTSSFLKLLPNGQHPERPFPPPFV